MQCPSCQFENMPGITACGRCGARLGLAGTEIDVHPPRASQWAKRVRRWVPFYWLGYRLRDAFMAFFQGIVPDLSQVEFDYGVFARMVVPGWAQLYSGQTRRGQLMLYSYLGMLFLGLAFLGTTFGAMMLGTAVAIHLSSIVDVIWGVAYDWVPRILATALIAGTIGAVVYFPAVWTFGQFVGVRRINITAGPLAAGDVFLYRPRSYARRPPQVGQVVLFMAPTRDIPTRTEQGYNAVYRVQGEFIDRILAGPGQAIDWDGNRLLVDGEPSSWLPMYPGGVSVRLNVSVPTGYYCIIPSTQPRAAPEFPADAWQTICLVPQYDIQGPVLLRSQPLWRWKRYF